jgi:hypothetical protein
MQDTELAKGLGIARQTVAKLRKAGMPNDSVESAREWRDQRTLFRKGPPRGRVISGIAKGILTESSNPKETLELIVSAQASVSAEIELAQAEGDRKNLCALWRELRGLATARMACERELLRWRVEQGELINKGDAIALYAGGFAEIRGILANVPDRLCALLNPDNPDAARRILWAELEQIGTAIGEKLKGL